MDQTTQNEAGKNAEAAHKPKRWWQRRWVKVMGIGFFLAGVALFCFAAYIAHNVEPILRRRVIETLSARFDAPVELDRLEISIVRGIQVRGQGLRIGRTAGPETPGQPIVHPMVSVQSFTFRTAFKGLLHQPTHIAMVEVQGMELHIPPAQERPRLKPYKSSGQQIVPKIALTVAEIRCRDVKLLIETIQAGKPPLEFEIQSLDLNDVGVGQPFRYHARLTNPKPLGQIDATGHFGPWAAETPRETPLDGDYSFDHADLNTIKGIGGILSSTGHFSGQLGRIVIDGTTDTPDFSLDISNHPVPLHTKFHAYVDGTTGDTTLDPVEARLLHSSFTARGTVFKVPGQGHDIQLDVDMPNARIEDMLQLGVKTSPALMTGALSMKTRLHIPPGKVRVAQKLELTNGTFAIRSVRFSNPKTQDRVDSMSMRAQGRPEDAEQAGSDRTAEVHSLMTARFNLAHGLITVDDLHYQIPGALVLMNGVYSTDGNIFEFKGHVRTDATASQMVTGWKSLLLKPVDRFLKKDGAGLELPVSISGTKGDVKFGLAMHGTGNDTSQQIAADMKARATQKREAEREAGEDERAAKKAARQPKPAANPTH